MNMASFAMIPPATFNPLAAEPTGAGDVALHAVNLILFDGRMRGLFAMLFGASMLLMAERNEAAGIDPGGAHLARMAWLLVFGLAHLYLLWHGDILHHYALVGLLAFLLRDLRVPALLIVGALLYIVQLWIGSATPRAVALAQAGLPDSASAAAVLARIERSFGTPASADIATWNAAFRDGGYGAALAQRWAEHRWTPLLALLFQSFDTLALMLWGMAAYRSGLLTGDWPRRRYRRWAMIGFGVSIVPALLLAGWLIATRYALYPVTSATMLLSPVVRVPMIVGWACLMVAFALAGGALAARFAAVGRMAFTNYIATSLICTTIFYGYGLGLYGRVDRLGQFGIMLSIWLALLAFSPWWLTRFRYGPLEWLWRSLATRKLAPFIASDTH
ncbi:DUF418 domain-containing protein [Sphingomonas baiyangensis]|uniref:DUF418 domain-containing protein n=2 Tax=Sphingomonas baiyangensis TaxID=2572576 RepID=A0A4U1L6W8_9SPHN|nr:DUF418 domain-containing protein [Sphingomonas baiyangensis]